MPLAVAGFDTKSVSDPRFQPTNAENSVCPVVDHAERSALSVIVLQHIVLYRTSIGARNIPTQQKLAPLALRPWYYFDTMRC